MKTNRIIYSLFFGAYSALIVGCATPGAEKEQVQESFVALNGNVPDSAILSEISDMKAGEKMAFGEKVFIVGKDYAAASGLRCKSVVITGTNQNEHVTATDRLVCEQDNKWFFSTNVFLTDL